MTIEYTVKSVTLAETDLIAICQYYEAACTAQYLIEQYEQVKTEKQAMELGYEVRRIMNKYGYCEDEAIDIALAENFDGDEDDNDDD